MSYHRRAKISNAQRGSSPGLTSLCVLCVLCVSVVGAFFCTPSHHRDTEDTEQRTESVSPLRPSKVNSDHVNHPSARSLSDVERGERPRGTSSSRNRGPHAWIHSATPRRQDAVLSEWQGCRNGRWRLHRGRSMGRRS